MTPSDIEELKKVIAAAREKFAGNTGYCDEIERAAGTMLGITDLWIEGLEKFAEVCGRFMLDPCEVLKV